MSAKRSLTRALSRFAQPFGSRDGQRPRPLVLLLLEGTTPETVRTVVEEVIREVTPDAASTDIDLISDLPWPSDARAALTAIASATGAREGETAVVLDLTDERQREWFITLVPHTISAEIWGPTRSGVSFSASDTGSAISWQLPAERWERVRARLRHRGIDPDTAVQSAT
ncbi:hypothetical protein GCM10010289_62960 [Streptomyces violascens]|uniref:Uncharacterized protein n=2 Tax=Streptomyces violascens TaxID=67381 RepID=A0ABQ3QSI3_9ACTN|nr:hypothetical protein GCM10010289_62960 [Streptomyces violascens]GHI40237.1 hypothetical protein Sviol_46450 [Streptomyces violascens]